MSELILTVKNDENYSHHIRRKFKSLTLIRRRKNIYHRIKLMVCKCKDYARKHFRIHIVSHNSDGFKGAIFDFQDPASHGVSQKQWVGLQSQYWERDTILCKSVRFQLLKRKINYLCKQEPCAVLSHIWQVIIWFMQLCEPNKQENFR